MSDEVESHKKVFIQWMFSRRTIPKQSLNDVLTSLEIPQSPLDFLRDVNSDLAFLDMKIQQGNDPLTGLPINCISDEIAQQGTNLTPSEIQYFKKLIEMIMTNEEKMYEISSNDALNCNSQIQPPISKQTAEKAIEKFVTEKWLIERDGILSLSVRTALELQPYLHETFDPFPDCEACKEPIYNISECCKSEECEVRMHCYCAAKKFERQEAKCPLCQGEWAVSKAGRKLVSRNTPTVQSRSDVEIIASTPKSTPKNTPTTSKRKPTSVPKSTKSNTSSQSVVSTPTVAKRVKGDPTPRPSKPSKRSRVVVSEDEDSDE